MSDGRKYYCFCEANCRFETMSKEQIIAAIAQAAESGLVFDTEAAFISKVKEGNTGSNLTFWLGTNAQYNALVAQGKKDPQCHYILTDCVSGAEMQQLVERLQQTVDCLALVATDPNNDGRIVLKYGGKVYPEGSGVETIDREEIYKLMQDVEKIKEELNYKEIAIVKFTNPAAGTHEIGSTINGVTMSCELNKTPESQTLNGSAIETDARSKEYADPITTNQTYALAVTDERGATATASTAINFYNGVYYGVLETGAAIDSVAVLSLTRKLQSSKGITFTANAGAAQKIVFALPTRYGTPNFNVGGFDGGFAKANTFDFTNASGYTESYDVWLSENVGLGSTTVKVS